MHHACNATGSHKLPLWIIAKYKRPRCFTASGLKSLESLGVKWRANKKAWMVTEIMVEWLRWFDSLMAGRKVILIMDNFSAHECAVGELEIMPFGSGLKNTEICWLPRNTTSKLRPLDQGIIASFEARHRRRWISYMLEQHEIGLDAFDSINMLMAVQWCIFAWDEVTAETIRNCWSHSAINLTPTTTTLPEDEAIQELRLQLIQLQQCHRIHEIMDINSLLNLPEEEVKDSSEDLDNHIIALCDHVDEQESDDEAVEVLPQIPPQQVLRIVQSVKLDEMQSDDCNAEYIRWFERYEKVVQQRHLDSLEQANTQSFFHISSCSRWPLDIVIICYNDQMVPHVFLSV